MHRNVLPEFQTFLRERKIVKEKHIPFYAYWVQKFLAFSNDNNEIEPGLKVQAFLNHLEKQQNISDWQVQQADNALRLYFTLFIKNNESIIPPVPTSRLKNLTDISIIIDKLREAIRIKHYSKKTEKTYSGWVKSFYFYVANVKNKGVDNPLETEDVKDYLSYLALKKKVSASTQNQAFNALLFLFRNIFGSELGDLSSTVRAKRGERLPVVLSVEEVERMFKQIKAQGLLILQILYGSGLRLMELARLRVKDIDFDAELIFVRNAKGDKDRTTILPRSIKLPLEEHLEVVKMLHQKDLAIGYGEVYLPDALSWKYPNAAREWHWQYAFPSARLSVDPLIGKTARHHISDKYIQRVLKDAVKKAGIAKHVSVHTLRHSFATHLLQNGVNIRECRACLDTKMLKQQ